VQKQVIHRLDVFGEQSHGDLLIRPAAWPGGLSMKRKRWSECRVPLGKALYDRVAQLVLVLGAEGSACVSMGVREARVAGSLAHLRAVNGACARPMRRGRRPRIKVKFAGRLVRNRRPTSSGAIGCILALGPWFGGCHRLAASRVPVPGRNCSFFGAFHFNQRGA
jgi:hypothetical protein